MKVIGLLGGMSWESSAAYYAYINTRVKEVRGGLHSARLLLYSVDFDEIERYQHQNNWAAAAQVLINAAQSLEAGGADFIVICTNTMHLLIDEIQHAISIPIIHIADATGQRIREQEFSTVGLLGTRFTMEREFYRGRLKEQYGLTVLTPNESQRKKVHMIIYEELCKGIVRSASREYFLSVIESLQQEGAEGVILGCTEIGMLISQKDTALAVFDTTRIHAEYAVEEALRSDERRSGNL